MQPRDIYNRSKETYSNEIKKIQTSALTSKNKELLLNFHKYLFANDCSEGRVVKLSWQMRYVGEWLEKDFDKATKDDIERVVCIINKKVEYSDNTKVDYRRVIKQFWKWLKGNGKYNPPETEWIKRKNGKLSNRILTGDIITKEEINKLIEACDNIRDKAFISFLYESGARIAEALNIKICDYKVNQHYAKVRVNGKTGERFITIIASVPYINQLLAIHPEQSNTNAYLWYSISNFKRNKPLKYSGIKVLIKRLFDKSKLNKKCNPHIFRHSRATELAKHLTEVQMCLYFGWVIGSGQTKTYVHASGRDVDDAIFNYYGLKNKEESDKPKANVICGRCKEINPIDAKYCFKCGLGLDLKTVLDDGEKIKTETNKTFQLLLEIAKNPELMKQLEEFRKQKQ